MTVWNALFDYYCLFVFSRIFMTVAKMNSASILALIPPNALVLGIFMYQLHQVIETLCSAFISLIFLNFLVVLQVVAASDAAGVFFFVMSVLCILFWPYFFCYFADSTSYRMANIHRSVYDLNWYNFPSDAQKCVVLIMTQSQKIVYFNGHNLITCTLVSFGKVNFIDAFLLFMLDIPIFLTFL